MKKCAAIVLSAILFSSVLSCGLKQDSYGSEYVPLDKIVMAWDCVLKKEDNKSAANKFADASLDVVSPTWFAISGQNGKISSLADHEYVRKAHANDIEVWAVFENRSDDALTWKALSSGKREEMLNQLTKYAKEYKLEGINVDFEGMSKKSAELFESMVIELYKKLKPLGICLSVDVPLNWPGDEYSFDLSVIAENSDYIVLMGYDQHHANSKVIGPVAGISWVTQGIEDTLKYVPAEKIILGIPFYTRIWAENTGNGRFTSMSAGMRSAYDLFEKRAAVWRFDEKTEQIYAEYKVGQVVRKVWLEDDHSLSLKLDRVVDYGLAGVSAWYWGLEWPETWDMINAYFN